MTDRYTYRIAWSDEDAGLCAEFPSLSWLAATSDTTLAGIKYLAAAVGADMTANSETLPEPLAAGISGRAVYTASCHTQTRRSPSPS